MRWRRILAWFAGALVLFAVIGFFAVPPIAKAKLESALSSALQRDVSIGAVAFNPFTLAADVSDLSIVPRGGGVPLLAVDRIYADIEASSLFRWAPIVSALRVIHPQVHLVRQQDGRYNISDLIDAALAPPAAAGPSPPPPRFAISNIEVVDGRVDFDDQPEHRQHVIGDIRLGVPFISSLPSNVQIYVEPAFAATVNGRPVAISGQTRPFEDSHETRLELDLSGLSLPQYMAYVPVPLRFSVTSGALDAKLALAFATHAGKPPTIDLSGSARIRGLVLTERGSAPLIAVPSLLIAMDKLDVPNRSLELRTVAIDGADVTIARSPEGALNLALLAPADAPAAPHKAVASANAKPFRFHLAALKVTNGKVHLTDAAVSPALDANLVDVTLSASNISNQPGAKAAIDAAFNTRIGEHIAHRGALVLEPLAFDGRLQILHLDLKRLYPYYRSAFNLEVAGGTLDAETDVNLSREGGATLFTLGNLDATLSALDMRLPGEREALWRVPTLSVRHASVDVPKRTVLFAEVEGKGALATIRRDADGSFNFDRILKPAEKGAPAQDRGGEWRVEASKVALDDFAVSFEDRTVAPPAHMALTHIAAAGENISNGSAGKGRVRIKAVVNKRGSIAIAGPLATAPFAGTLSLTAKDVDLVPFQPYVTPQARVIVTAGAVSTQGTLDFASAKPAHASYKGDVTVNGLATLDEANTADLIKWRSLHLGGVAARNEPLAVSIDDIQVQDFYARLLLNENGEFNLQRLGRDQPAPSGEEATKTARVTPGSAGTATAVLPAKDGGAVAWLKLGKATLFGGNIDFTDHFIKPNYSANLTGIEGTLSTLSFTTPADVELHGAVDNAAPVAISGRINPLAKDLFLDLKATAKDIDLSPTSPYSGKYAGYGIRKGKLSVDVHYAIENRKLSADNRLVLDQLTFGDKVESPDATKLPVLLAVALLKDRNGVIDIKLPISGSLDDPHFSVGGIVIQALINLIVKIVTSPFALLGSLAGGSEQLAYVEFAPGAGKIDAAGEAKLKTLAKALLDRPALKLDIAGRADPATDREGLKHATLERRVRQQRFNDLVKEGDPPASVDDVKIPEADYAALLARVYKAADITKPKNALGFAKDIPSEEMEKLLLDSYSADEEALRDLANERAQRAKSFLVETEHVPAERIFLVAPNLGSPSTKDSGKPTRVDFALH